MSEVFSYVKPPLSSAEFPDLLPGGSAVTGEAGTVSGQSGQPAPHVKAAGIYPLAKPLLTLPGDALPLPDEGLSAVKRSDAVSPGVYRSPKVRSDSRCIREAAAKQAREGAHYLRLNDREYLHVYAAVEQDRNRTRKAIRKGVADPQDLKASDSLWQALQDVQARRLKKAWRL